MEPCELHLEPISVGDCAILRVTGVIDASTVPDLRDALNRSGIVHLVIDLRSVSFLDSSGLGVLVGALKRLRRCGGSLTIVTDRFGPVWRLFELTNLTRAFDLHTSVLDAVASDTYWRAATDCNPAGWCLQQGLR